MRRTVLVKLAVSVLSLLSSAALPSKAATYLDVSELLHLSLVNNVL
jgi:hypothetical protein